MTKALRTTGAIALALICILLALSLAACASKDKSSDESANQGEAQTARLSIVCSIFPVYDFARTIAGDRADVYQLLPRGMDSHDYEPSVGDMVSSDKADLFIYTDDEMETWIKNLSAGFTHVKLIRCARGIDLEALNEQWELIENEHDEDEHSHSHKYDAHIWLDPTLAIKMCENIRDALIQADDTNAEYYRTSCAALVSELNQLDREFEELFAQYPNAVLYFGGEFSYSHFIRRYNVKYLSAYDGCSEDDEVNQKALILIIEDLKAGRSKYIFTDEMSNNLIANEIARESGAGTLLFHSLHNLSASDGDASYIEIMQRNYDAVKQMIGGE